MSTLDSYLEMYPNKRVILMKHFSGISPSRIDKQCGLVKGEARMVISEFWSYDKAMRNSAR